MHAVQNTRQLSAYLRALRRIRGLTQRELGSMLGVSAARIGKIERDPGAVTLDKFLEVLRMLGARIELIDQTPTTSSGRSDADSPAGRATPSPEPRTGRGAGHRPAGEW